MIIGFRKIYSLIVVLSLVLLITVGAAQPCLASNGIGDLLVLSSTPEVKELAILFKERPDIGFKVEAGGRFMFVLHDMDKNGFLNQTLVRFKDSLTLEEESKSSALKFHILLEKPFRSVSYSWLEDKKILYLKVESMDDGDNILGGKNSSPKLKNIRFGAQSLFTRVVMGITGYPLWEMTKGKEDMVAIRMAVNGKAVKQDSYGPVKRIKKLSLKKESNNIELDLLPAKALKKMTLFWLKDGNRLVMDIFDSPGKIPETALNLKPHFDIEDKEKKAVKTAKKEELKDKQETIEPLVADIAMEKAGEPQPDADTETTIVVNSADDGHIVRGKIIKKPLPVLAEPGLPETKKAAAELPPPIDIDPKIKPELENATPEKSKIDTWAKDLNADEAYQFGRIQEAWDLRDYEKGAELINQFLTKFPESSLCEHISFLKGDFQLYLLRSGRKEMLPEVITSYRESINKYRNSVEIPGAYIKMAQANSLGNKHYEALGALGLVINNFKDSDELPKALLERGRVYQLINQYDKAIEDFKIILNRFGSSKAANEARFWIANYYHNKGVYDEAERWLEEVAGDDPGFFLEYPEYLFLHARNLFYLNKYDPAREYYLKGLNIGRQPESSDLLLSHIGDTYHHQEQEEDAKRYYQLAVDSFPGSEGAAIAKLRLAKYSEGVEDYEDVRNSNLNKPIGDLALLEMTNKLYSEGKFKDAAAAIKPLIQNPSHEDILKQAKKIFAMAVEKEISRLYRKRSYEGVIDFVEEAGPTIKNEIDPSALFLVAESHYRLKDFKEAVSYYSDITIHDLDEKARGGFVLDFAKAYIKEGEDESAEKLLDKKRKDSAVMPEGRQRITILLSELLAKGKRFEKAYNLYSSVINGKRLVSDIEIAKVYLAMGQISNQRKKYEKARELLNRTVALAERGKGAKDPLQMAFMELGDSYYHEKKFTRAIGYYKKGVDLGYAPDKEGYYETRFREAMSYMNTGKDQEAERILSQIAEEGGPILQQKIQIKLGVIGLEEQLKRLPFEGDISDG